MLSIRPRPICPQKMRPLGIASRTIHPLPGGVGGGGLVGVAYVHNDAIG